MIYLSVTCICLSLAEMLLFIAVLDLNKKVQMNFDLWSAFNAMLNSFVEAEKKNDKDRKD